MAKSISLSTDMKLMYLTENNGLTAVFSLTGNGIFITSIIGEVHVVAASKPLQNGTDELSIAPAAQWAATFHEGTNQALFVGDDDVVPTVTGQIKKYDLSGGNVINLRLDSTQTKLLIRT